MEILSVHAKCTVEIAADGKCTLLSVKQFIMGTFVTPVHDVQRELLNHTADDFLLLFWLIDILTLIGRPDVQLATVAKNIVQFIVLIAVVQLSYRNFLQLYLHKTLSFMSD